MPEPDSAEDDIEQLKQEARDRWGEKWAIETQHYSDGTSESHAYRIVRNEDTDVQVKDRLFVGSDGDVYHDRVRVAKERILDVVDRDDPPATASEIVEV